MTQTCETCETCRYWDDRTCWGEPRACTREARRPACSLYRALVSDKERKAEEAVIWAARQQAQADVASMLGKAHVYKEPSEYNIKCTVTEPCAHEPKGMSWGGFMDTTNTCANCGKRIMRDLSPWREEQ